MLESVLRDIADAESNRALATAARTPRPVAVTARNSPVEAFQVCTGSSDSEPRPPAGAYAEAAAAAAAVCSRSPVGCWAGALQAL